MHHGFVVRCYNAQDVKAIPRRLVLLGAGYSCVMGRSYHDSSVCVDGRHSARDVLWVRHGSAGVVGDDAGW